MFEAPEIVLRLKKHHHAGLIVRSEEPVRALFAHIAQDSRHDSIAVLETGPAARVFGRWAMARVSVEGEPDIPLIAPRDGISPAASRGSSPGQEAVLDVMRQAIKADTPAG